MDEKICRLCLKTICDDDGQRIDEIIREILNDVLKLNLDISNEAVTCGICVENLQVSSNFKTTCAYIKDRLPSTTLKSNVQDLQEITNTNQKPFETFDQEICTFCSKATRGGGFLPISQRTEPMFIMNMIQTHLPELNINNIEDLVTCEKCLNSLRCLLNFIMKCLNVEKKIRMYVEIEGTDGKGQVALRDIREFNFKPKFKFEPDCNVGIKEEINESPGGIIIRTETELKKEQADNPENSIEHEELCIKSEPISCVSLPSSTLSPETSTKSVGRWRCLMVKFCENPLEKSESEYEMCQFSTHNKNDLRKHVLTHRFQGKLYHCEICSYKTDDRTNFKRHMIVHKDVTEVTIFKCQFCSFITKYRSNQKRHMQTHKAQSDTTVHLCDICLHEAEDKKSLKTHELSHKNQSEMKMYTCRLCSFESKDKRSLKRHLTMHQEESEIATFECDKCMFVTKRRDYLKRHMLMHVPALEKPIYRCDMCPYETRDKRCLRRHSEVHKDASEVTMYKCISCPYKTRYGSCIKKHQRKHKKPSELEMYQCNICSYKGKDKEYLKTHMIVHKDPSEVTMHKCEYCEFSTKYKNVIKKHTLNHKKK